MHMPNATFHYTQSPAPPCLIEMDLIGIEDYPASTNFVAGHENRN